jgi:hypothetical protein
MAFEDLLLRESVIREAHEVACNYIRAAVLVAKQLLLLLSQKNSWGLEIASRLVDEIFIYILTVSSAQAKGPAQEAMQDRKQRVVRCGLAVGY